MSFSEQRKPLVRTVFVDESIRSARYYVLAALVPNRELGGHRKAIRGLLKPGQRVFHAKKESDNRRREALHLVADRKLRVRIYQISIRSPKEETQAREQGLTRLVKDLGLLDATRLVIEHRDGQDQRDNRTILRQRPKTNHNFEFAHIPQHAEPMLWVADLVGWAYGKGGQWRKLTTDLDLIDTVIQVEKDEPPRR